MDGKKCSGVIRSGQKWSKVVRSVQNRSRTVLTSQSRLGTTQYIKEPVLLLIKIIFSSKPLNIARFKVRFPSDRIRNKEKKLSSSNLDLSSQQYCHNSSHIFLNARQLTI